MPAIGPIARPRPIDLFVGAQVGDWSNASAVWTTANACVACAFQVSRPVLVTTANFRVATASGNMDCALLDAGRNRLASTGSFAVPAAGVSKTQALAASASVLLVPGLRYYSAMAVDNVTAAITGYATTGQPAIAGLVRHGTLAATFPIPAGPIALAEISGAAVLPLLYWT